MARKGRARRFREARQLKQGYEDGLFVEEGSGTLADLDVDADHTDDDASGDWTDEDDDEPGDDGYDWDPDRAVD